MEPGSAPLFTTRFTPRVEHKENSLLYFCSCEKNYNDGRTVTVQLSDILLTNKKIGNFVFKHPQESAKPPFTPLDLVNCKAWIADSYYGPLEQCKICPNKNTITYSVTLEWGDTQTYEDISEVCSKCLNSLNHAIVRNKDPNKFWG